APVKTRAPAEICPYVNEGCRPPQRGNVLTCSRGHHQKKKRGEQLHPARKASLALAYSARLRRSRLNPTNPTASSESEAGSGAEVCPGPNVSVSERTFCPVVVSSAKNQVKGKPDPEKVRQTMLAVVHVTS